jgi:hypothetical protein
MNFGTAWQDNTTAFSEAGLNPLTEAHDKAISYHHNMIVHCDGNITYNEATGVLAWSGALQIIFLGSDGKAYYNSASSGDVTLSDNEFAYVDLTETDGNTMVVSKAAITTDTAANFSSTVRAILGYRNTTSNEFYPVLLREAFGTGGSGGTGIESFIVAASDETTDLTTGSKVAFRMPYGFTLSDVRASVNVAPTDATIIIDINEGGSSILSTKLSIDIGELTSTTAAVPVVISDPDLADDAAMNVDIDQIGSTIAGKGLKITLIGVQS